MDLNELVRLITKEVLQQLKQQQPCEAESNSDKPCVMILENRDCESVAMVVDYLGGDADILFLNEDKKESIPDRYILPILSIGRMADIATGRASEPLTDEVIRLLLSGTSVEVFEFEYKSYSDTAPEALYGLYESYEKTLASYGMKAISRYVKGTVRVKKRLITEKDVIQANENGASVLQVSENAVITSLAADSARDLNVRLLKQ